MVSMTRQVDSCICYCCKLETDCTDCTEDCIEEGFDQEIFLCGHLCRQKLSMYSPYFSECETKHLHIHTRHTGLFIKAGPQGQASHNVCHVLFARTGGHAPAAGPNGKLPQEVLQSTILIFFLIMSILEQKFK